MVATRTTKGYREVFPESEGPDHRQRAKRRERGEKDHSENPLNREQVIVRQKLSNKTPPPKGPGHVGQNSADLSVTVNTHPKMIRWRSELERRKEKNRNQLQCSWLNSHHVLEPENDL